MSRAAARGVCRSHGQRRYGYVKFDYSKAHNRIKVASKDWKYQCVTWRNSHYVQTVGCFGTSSIAYYCSRLLAYIKRLKHLLFGGDWFELLYADDTLVSLLLGSLWPQACCHMLFVVLVGGPISWHETAVGLKLDWIGFSFNGLSFSVGVRRDRALDVADGLEKLLQTAAASPEEFLPIVGKLAWGAQALEWLRPWLQPFYSFMHGPPAHVKIPIPSFLRFVGTCVSQFLREEQQYIPIEFSELAKFEAASEAAASETGIGVGGWIAQDFACQPDSISKKMVYWFHVEITHDNCPWAYDGASISSRIAALEVLGTLFLILAAAPRIKGARFAIGLPQTTDNQNNGFVMSKLCAATQPSASILMCICSLCRKLNCLPVVRWRPRESNQWADDLAKGRKISTRLAALLSICRALTSSNVWLNKPRGGYIAKDCLVHCPITYKNR